VGSLFGDRHAAFILNPYFVDFEKTVETRRERNVLLNIHIIN
jgi:hypothetical protein